MALYRYCAGHCRQKRGENGKFFLNPGFGHRNLGLFLVHVTWFSTFDH
jgi:hypothetical protein